MSRAIRVLLAAFYLTFPLMNVGIVVSGYPLSIPLAFLWLTIACIPIGLLTGALRLRLGAAIGMMSFWGYAALVTLSRGQLDTGLISLVILLGMLVPLCIDFPIPEGSDHLRKWFLRGHYLNWGICGAALLLQLTTGRALGAYVPVMTAQRTTALAEGFNRINGLMIEPSFLALYLVYGYIVNDIAAVPEQLRRLSRPVFIGLLLLTGSVSGWVLWGFYMGLRAVQALRAIPSRFRLRMSLSRRTAWWLGLTLCAVLILAIVGRAAAQKSLSALAHYLFYRADRIAQYLRTSSYLSSEGVRLSAIPIAAQYVREGRVFGEGYSLVEPWLKSHTWLASGNIHNVYTYLLIGFGLPGLALFLALIASTLDHTDKGHAWILAVWILTGFAAGYLILYNLWGYLYLLVLARPRASSPSGLGNSASASSPAQGDMT